MNRGKKVFTKKTVGSALVYVLLLSAILLVFCTALFYRFILTLRCITHDESYVQARFLADSGAQFAVTYMKENYKGWRETIRPRLPLRSESLNSSYYRPGVLRGTFSIDEYHNPSLYPNRYTDSYVTIISTGKCGMRTARTLVTLKVTNPLINYLLLSNGDLEIRGYWSPKVRGPIYVNENEQEGEEGNFNMWHDSISYSAIYKEWLHYKHHPELDAEIKARGKIYIQNHISDSPGPPEGPYPSVHDRPPLYFDGVVPPQAITYDDFSPADAGGTLTLTDTLYAQPNVEQNVKINTMQEIMQSYRDLSPSDKIEIAMPDRPEGILAEFMDGSLYISEAETKSEGRVFDKDLYEQPDSHGEIEGMLRNYYKSTSVDSIFRQQITWDDPDYENVSYPPSLQGDLDGVGGAETEGDSFEVRRIVRGDIINTIPLSRSEFQVVYIKTGRTNFMINGQEQAPPLYVRGNVKGKAAVVYDVTQDSLDPDYNKLHTIILTQHEAPDDVGSGSKITPADLPGVPGGIRYENPRIRRDQEQETFTGDSLILVSRGSINAAGDTGKFKKVWTGSGTQVDYTQQLADRNAEYRAAFTKKYGDVWAENDYMLTDPDRNIWNNCSFAPAYGVFIGQESVWDYNCMASDGTIVPEAPVQDEEVNPQWRKFSRNWGMDWGYYPTRPSTVQEDDFAAVPFTFRMTNTNRGCEYFLKGSLSSVGSHLETSAGTAEYDYQFQSLSTQDLNAMGLPLTVIVCNWQQL